MVLVTIAIAPVFVVVVQAALAEQRGRLQRAEANLQGLVELGAAQQQGMIEGARLMLNAMAHSPSVYGDDVAACAEYLRKLQQQFPPAYGTFGILDLQGRLTCRSAPTGSTVQSSDRGFFRTAIRTGQFSVGEYTVSRASGRHVLPLGLPVFREDGVELRGVAYVALDVAQMADQLERLAVSPEVTLVVTDAAGVVLGSAGPHAYAAGSSLPQGVMRSAIATGARQFDRFEDAGGTEWLFGLQPVGRPGERKLFVAGLMERDAVLAAWTRRVQLQLAALAVIAMLGVALAWVFADRVVLRPMQDLLRRVETLAREGRPLERPPPPTALREAGELNGAFDAMALRLAERAAQRDSAMAELQHQKNLLESVLESMAEGVLVVDAQGRVAHANEAARRILPGTLDGPDLGVDGSGGGSAPGQADDWDLYSVDGTTPCAPEDRPSARALRGETVESFRLLAHVPRADGRATILQGSARPIVMPEGEASGAVVVFSDHTDAHHAELALRDSEFRYRTLFMANPHPMWVFDAKTLRFLNVNDAAVARYGYSRGEFLAMTIADIRNEEDVPALRRNVASLAGPLSTPRHWRHRLKDGREIRVEVISHEIDFEGSPAWLVLAHDVTALVEAEEALRQLNETLERRVQERTRALALANQELESFSYSVSHDLRAPLQVIDGFGRALMARHGEHLDANARHYVERMRDNTRQMGQLIDDLLGLARVTRAEIALEPCDLAPAARTVVERLRQGSPGRQVEVRIDATMPCMGDPRLLQIVLENLIGNAWKFSARTGEARLHIGMEDNGPAPVYFVADNGAGFDMAYADKLFKAFQRLHSTVEFEGTGIGLATVHRIVTRHGGRVWAESAPGVRTVFSFTLQQGGPHEEQPHPAGRGQPGPPGAHADDPGGEQRPQ
jgi:PAS domain S-box-containing protein